VVGDLQRGEGDLLDQQHRHAGGRQRTQRTEDAGDDLRCQAQRGLVEHQHARAHHQRARHGQHLLLAAGQRSARNAAPFAQHRKPFEFAGEPGLEVGTAQAGQAAGADQQVVFDAQRGDDLASLGHVDQSHAGDVVRRYPGQFLAVEADAAGAQRQQARQRAQQRRLAGAVGADDRDQRAGGDVEIDAMEHRHAAEAHLQPLDAQQAHASSVPR
jgi:hypothetical protein